MTYQPLGDRILLQDLPKETQTKSGIFIPDTVKVTLQKAKVIAVGELITTVKPNDIVMYDKDSGEPIEFNDVQYVRTRYAALESIIS